MIRSILLPRYSILLIAICAILATICISVLPLNGVDQAMISQEYYSFAAPAGFVFSIWGIIYTSWVIIGIHQLRGVRSSILEQIIRKLSHFSHGRNDDHVKGANNIAENILGSVMFLSVIWLFFWHFRAIFGSVLVMLLMFSLLYFWWTKYRQYSRSSLRYTLELLSAWIAVALGANIGSLLVSQDIVPDLVSQTNFALFFVIPYLSLLLFFFTRSNSRTALAVIAWSSLGLFIERIGSPILEFSFLLLFVISLTLFVANCTTRCNRLSKKHTSL